MTRFMLDTNIVSHLMRAHPTVTQRLRAVPMQSLCISAVTEGELHFGLAKHPNPRRDLAAQEFLRRVESLPWDSHVAQHYGKVRAGLERQGIGLAALDLMIAAHTLSVEAILVSNDHAFRQVPGLAVEDWTQP